MIKVNIGNHISNARPPGRFLQLSHHGDVSTFHQEFLHRGSELVHDVLGLRVVAAAFVAALPEAEVQQRLPAAILAENVRVAHNDQQGLGSKM